MYRARGLTYFSERESRVTAIVLCLYVVTVVVIIRDVNRALRALLVILGVVTGVVVYI